MQNITIVTGYFDINRGEWKKYNRSNSDYFRYFEQWCIIKNRMVVFVDNKELADKVAKARERHGLGEKTKVVVVDNYPNIAPDLLDRIDVVTRNLCQRNFRMQPENPEVINPYYNYVMLLKEWCVAEAVKLDYADGMIAWIDFGFNHGGETIDKNSFWGFEWKYSFPEKICLFNNNPIDDNRPIFDVIRTMDVYIMGTVIVAPSHLWIKLWEMVKQSMESLCDCGLVDDDQTILLMVYLKNKDICQLYPSSWNKQLYDYSEGQTKLKLIKSEIHKCARWKAGLKRFRWNLRCAYYCIKQYGVIKK